MKSDSEAFILILANRTMLKLYIMSIVKDWHLAEDTLSDVTLAITDAWSNYDKSRPFGPWARGIAKRVSLANLRKLKHKSVVLDDDILDQFGADLAEMSEEAEQEETKQRLKDCVNKLHEKSRELVQLRYYQHRSYDEISHDTGRTLDALYMAFSRIHKQLGKCVRGGG